MRTDSAGLAELMGGPFNAMNTSENEFHAGGGLTFTRTESHGIMVRLWERRTFSAEPSDDGWHFRVLAFVSDDAWQSINKAIRAGEVKP
jgi:hypothetical protein